MAKAVTLKNNNDEEVYPVTDLSLVNGNIPTERIADGAVTTGKIANKAVTSDKINWTTMSHVSNANSSVVVDVRQAVTILCAVTIPETGVYYASAVVDPNLLANEVGNANVCLALNGSGIGGSYVFFNNPSKTWFIGGCHVSAIISCNKDDRIQICGQSEMNHWQTGRFRLDAFRIG